MPRTGYVAAKTLEGGVYPASSALDTGRVVIYKDCMSLFVLSCIVVLIHLAAPGAVQAHQSAAPRFERAACPVEVAADERIDCGALLVPENRNRTGSRTIRLPVMIFRSRSSSPAPDPILFLTGGPGNSGVAGRRSARGIPFLDERDYVVMEQRGTRYAQPDLECPAINAIKGEIAADLVMAFLRAPASPLPVDCALRIRGADFGLSARGGKPPVGAKREP